MTAVAMLPRTAVTLRKAVADDCEQVWAWNFAPEVRARSKRADAVAFLEHARWFARRLADGDAPIWIVEDCGAPVGVIRLDPIGSGLARISIAVAGDARGRGIGKAAVAAACVRWGQPILAEIFADNLASRACFEACGFRSVVACDGLLTYHWDPEI